jgi:hypothetical protein
LRHATTEPEQSLDSVVCFPNSYGVLGGKKYVFRSSNTGSLTEKEFVKMLATFNTTITEPDTLAVLNAMKTLIIKYAALGFSVQTPLGIFHSSAGGSAENLEEAFDPEGKNNDHNIRLLYRASTEVSSCILADTKVNLHQTCLRQQRQ